MRDTDRPIDENHEQALKQILRLSESETLPDNVVELYWDVNRTARRLGFSLSDRELLLILILVNRPVQEPPASFLTLIKDKAVAVGDVVLAKHRDEWHWGNYKRMVGKQVLVQLKDDTGEDREFQPICVRLPTKEEKDKIGVA